MKRLFPLLLCAFAFAPRVGAAPLSSGVAPDFSLPDERGTLHTLKSQRGKIVVLNFWAFWCNTWNHELPHLRRLATRQQAENFSLICVSTDGTRVQEWRRQRGADVTWPVLLDFNGVVRKRYNVAHVPTIVIIDAQGRARFAWEEYPGNGVVLRAIAGLQRGEPVRAWKPPHRRKRGQKRANFRGNVRFVG